MYSSWIPQNIQKRLLLYILQQLSLFSEVDLPNLEEVSLNNIHLRSVSIDPEKFDKIPGFRLRHGTIRDFILTGGVVDGVNVDISGVDLVVAPSLDNIKQDLKDVESSLAQSSMELSQAIIDDSAIDDSAIDDSAIDDTEADNHIDTTGSPQKITSAPSNEPKSQEPHSDTQRRSSFSGGVMTKALDMALSRIRVSVRNIKIKIVIESIDLEFAIEKISFDSKNGLRSLSFSGVSASTLKPAINPGNLGFNNAKDDSPSNSDSEYTSELASESESDVDDADLMESKVFSKEEASSIYMSAISSDFEKHPAPEKKAEHHDRVMLFYIDKIDAEFEKLFPFSDMTIVVDSLKIASVPLIPSLSLIFNSLSKTVKLKNHQIRKTNFAQRLSRTKGENIQGDELPKELSQGADQIFDAIKIKCIKIGVTSALTTQGNFASTTNDLELVMKNVTVKQKGSHLIYGGIESLTAIGYSDDVESRVFFFDNTDPKEESKGDHPTSPSKADIRFEYSTNKANDEENRGDSDNELTILLHKAGKFKSDVSSLQYLLNLSKTLQILNEDMSTFMRDLRLMSELKNETKPTTNQWKGTYGATENLQQKKKERTQVLLQTASLEITLLFSEDRALKTTVYPISLDNFKEHMYIHRVVSEYLSKDKRFEVIVLPKISMRFDTKEFSAYRFSSSREIPEKVTLTGAFSVQIGEIESSVDHKIFEALAADLTCFWEILQLRNECINSPENLNKALFENPKNNFTKSHILNAGRSMRGNGGQVKFGERKPQTSVRVSLKSIRISIKNILGFFGDAEIKLSNFTLYGHSAGVTGYVNLIEVIRISENKKQPIVSRCLVADHPMLHFNVSESRPAPEIIFRGFQIDYYTTLLQKIQEFKQECYRNRSPNIGGLEASENKERRVDSTTKMHKNKTDTGNIEIHCTAYNLVLGISPLRLPSKLVCVVSKGTMIFSKKRGVFSLKQTFRDLNVLLIDEISNFRTPSGAKNCVFHLVSGGYSQIGVVSTLHFGLKVLPVTANCDDSAPKNEDTSLEVKVNADSVRASLCADSCHALLQTASDLKVPVIFNFEDRCKVNVDTGFHWPEDILDELKLHGVNVVVNPNLSPDSKLDSTFPSKTIPMSAHEECGTGSSKLPYSLGKSDSGMNVLNSSSLHFTEGHFYQKEKSTVASTPTLIFKLNVSKIEIYLHDGYDWKSTRVSLADSIKSLKNRAQKLKARSHDEEESKDAPSLSDPESGTHSSDAKAGFQDEEDFRLEVSDTLFKSIHLSSDVTSEDSNLVELINCQLQGDTLKEVHTNVDVKSRIKDLKLKRSPTHKVKVELKNLSTDYINFTSRDPRFDPTPHDLTVELLNKLELRIDDLTVFDNVATSSWNKFLTYMSILGDRELGTEMFNLEMTNVRPDANLAFAEVLMKIKVLPLRLYIDQDTLGFLTRFFEFKDTRFAQPGEDPVYIQKLEIEALRMKFDYKPKKVDFNGIRAGNNAELANFFALDGSDLSLKRAVVYGVHGYAKVGEALGRIYTPHIRKSQLSGLLSGLSPVKSIFNLKNGVRDLLTIPLTEYKRDGRLLYGIQKGTKSFAKITTSELLRLGVKLASGTQVVLENSEEYFGGEGTKARKHVSPKQEKKTTMTTLKHNQKKNLLETSQILRKSVSGDLGVGSKPRRYLQASIDEEESIEAATHEVFDALGDIKNGLGDLQSSVVLLDDSDDLLVLTDDSSENDESSGEEQQKKVTSLYSNQPVNSGEGLKYAYKSLGKNFKKTKQMLVSLKEELRDANSYQEQLNSIAKSSPVIIIRPIIGTTEAVMKTLMGVSNGIDSKLLVENQDKYRSEDSSHDN